MELPILGDLFKMLNQERIERTVVRSQAIYDLSNENKCTIRVLRKNGQWNLYGYTVNSVLYLHEHEALYLIAMVSTQLLNVN